MTLTLLLDLDDTLIENNMVAFAPAYSKKLGAQMASLADPERVINTLWRATGVMTKNHQPDRTLEETFDAAFYPALGIEKSAAKDLIDHFYRTVFPSLRQLTQQIPEGIHLVQEAFQRGYRVAIATNPLFPLTAILQRLTWAGLDSSTLPFALIPSFETLHFAKPDAAYYAELMARLGWPEGSVVMVGDDLQLDILPARQAGLPTFWITKQGQDLPPDPALPSGYGSQAEVLPWLDRLLAELPEKQLYPDFSTPSALISFLRATPAALDYIQRISSPEQLRQRPAAGEWSTIEIICHLRDVDAEVHLPRLRAIMQRQNPFLEGIDTDSWAEERQYRSQDGQASFRSFCATRLNLVGLLESLQASDWQRNATHGILGPIQLFELVKIIASHDRLHIQQISKNNKGK